MSGIFSLLGHFALQDPGRWVALFALLLMSNPTVSLFRKVLALVVGHYLA